MQYAPDSFQHLAQTFRIAAWPLEYAIRVQTKMLEATQTTTLAWMERHRAGAGETIDAAGRMMASQDLQEAMAIHERWLRGCIGRLEEDFRAFTNQAQNMSREGQRAASEGQRVASEAKDRATTYLDDAATAATLEADRIMAEGAEAVRRTSEE